MKSRFAALVVVMGLMCVSPVVAGPVTIDFESIAPGIFVTNQFANLGLLVSGTGSFSGLVFQEGDAGIFNFGNSPTHVMHIGDRGQPTTLMFVDPADGVTIVGATQFSILMGDGNADAETFLVEYFGVGGAPLGGVSQFTTFANGLLVSATSAGLGAPIGSVKLTLKPGSASGVVSDDLQFQLTNTGAVPEPTTLTVLLLGTGLVGIGLSRRKQ